MPEEIKEADYEKCLAQEVFEFVEDFEGADFVDHVEDGEEGDGGHEDHVLGLVDPVAGPQLGGDDVDGEEGDQQAHCDDNEGAC